GPVGGLTQAFEEVLVFRGVRGMGAVVLHGAGPRGRAEPPLQGAPDPAEGHVAEDVEGGADGPQGPAARRRGALRDGPLAPGLLAGALAGPVAQRLGGADDASRARRPADGRATPGHPPPAGGPATHTRYPGRSA